MAVQKYKPKSGTHAIDEFLSRNAENTQRVMARAKDAIARTKQLVAASREMVKKAKQQHG